jgi:hypothetical protein
MWGGSPQTVSKHVMPKPQCKRRRRETDQTRVEAAQRPKPWVRNREKRALKGRNRFLLLPKNLCRPYSSPAHLRCSKHQGDSICFLIFCFPINYLKQIDLWLCIYVERLRRACSTLHFSWSTSPRLCCSALSALKPCVLSGLWTLESRPT